MEQHGKPLALYSDKANVFRVNSKDAQGGDGHTQYAYLPLFMADYNRRFGKPARSDFDVHRPIRDDEKISR